jgi:formate hydrogenlyase transcriptional activator
LVIKMGKQSIESVSKKSVEALQSYSWPGNVRELHNVIERAMIITTGPVLCIEIPEPTSEVKETQLITLEEMERGHIIEVLNSTAWKVSGRNGAAEILGLNAKTMESKMKKLGIQRQKSIS